MGWTAEAQVLMRRGIRPLCIFVDPQSFNPQRNSDAMRGMLQLAKIPTVVIGKNDDIAVALEQRPI